MKQVEYIIGLSGGSGSGKSCILRDVRERFSENDLCIIQQDNYYIPRDRQLTDENGIKNFDLPEGIDSNALYQDLLKLRKGDSVTRAEYVFNNELKESKTISIKAAPILLLEGLFIYHYQPVFDLIDLKLFVIAPDNTKLIRRIKRDQLERNYPIEDVLYRYEHHVSPSYEKYILPYKKHADIIINNSYGYEKALEVLTSYIESKLIST